MISMTLKPLICLMGPTASGKTEIAIKLCQDFPFEIISVDSVMVYQGLNIGTAKPDQATLKIAPHHLIDISDPAHPYSAGNFYQDAHQAIQNCYEREKTPLLVGGTMLYFHVLLKGIASMPKADSKLRAKLSHQAEQNGWPVLHEKLREIDAAAAARIHPHDSQRIQRALEVYYLSGRCMSDWHGAKSNRLSSYKMIPLAMAPSERSILHQAIEKRFDNMLQIGFLDEVETLRRRGDLDESMPCIRSVGYRQAWGYLKGELTYEAMRFKAIVATRQLAKRQMTWLRGFKDAYWFDSSDPKLIDEIITYLINIDIKQL